MKEKTGLGKAGLVLSLCVVLILGMGAKKNEKGSESDNDLPEVQVVKDVDLSRYAGKWYEIALIPTYFERKCAGGTTATYTLRLDGDIDVLNQCYDKDREMIKARGVAWVLDGVTTAKLKVSFISFLRFNFLAGDYWIIDLGPDYEYAVVGHPKRTYGWILSRTPELPEDVFSAIAVRLEAQGYDFSRFRMTAQKGFEK
jgi:apolipoprotein D and lipocalin family protein